MRGLRENRVLWATLALLLAGYLALGRFGFGTDQDSYAMVRTGLGVLEHGTYVASRSPGYPLPEMLFGASAMAGGAWASNAVPAFFAVAALACFYALLRPRFGRRIALLATAAVGVNPHWVIASTSSVDYIPAVAFFLAGLMAVRAQSPGWASVAFAACAASRLTYLPLVLLVFGTWLCHPWGIPRRRLLASLAAFAALCALAYLPAYRSMGLDMFRVSIRGPVSFFGMDGFGSLREYLFRFGYKNVMLWGLPACLILFWAALPGRSGARASTPGRGEEPARRWMGTAWLAVLYCEVLFLRMPLEIPYLIPVLLLLIYWAASRPRAPLFLALLVGTGIVQGIVSPDLIDIRYSEGGFADRQAQTIRIYPGLRTGPLVEDMCWRREASAEFMPRYLPEFESKR